MRPNGWWSIRVGPSGYINVRFCFDFVIILVHLLVLLSTFTHKAHLYFFRKSIKTTETMMLKLFARRQSEIILEIPDRKQLSV